MSIGRISADIFQALYQYRSRLIDPFDEKDLPHFYPRRSRGVEIANQEPISTQICGNHGVTFDCDGIKAKGQKACERPTALSALSALTLPIALITLLALPGRAHNERVASNRGRLYRYGYLYGRLHNKEKP